MIFLTCPNLVFQMGLKLESVHGVCNVYNTGVIELAVTSEVCEELIRNKIILIGDFEINICIRSQ